MQQENQSIKSFTKEKLAFSSCLFLSFVVCFSFDGCWADVETIACCRVKNNNNNTGAQALPQLKCLTFWINRQTSRLYTYTFCFTIIIIIIMILKQKVCVRAWMDFGLRYGRGRGRHRGSDESRAYLSKDYGFKWKVKKNIEKKTNKYSLKESEFPNKLKRTVFSPHSISRCRLLMCFILRYIWFSVHPLYNCIDKGNISTPSHKPDVT